ncbi:MAG: CPBP family intramembrane metalloprotease [Clostridia bacterium]|nr:CPBP family intramembrane metalloprotease [Clostridia bacterium]
MNKRDLIVFSLLACILLYIIEQVLSFDYISKTVTKVILFAVIPFIYLKFAKKSSIKEIVNFKKVDFSTFKLGLFFGIFSFAVILVSYLLLGKYIDFNGIMAELQNKSKITPTNFLFVGLYITFGNSFLEEFFFRGFIFLNLYNQGHKKLAYSYSSVLFGVYHIVIFKTWFNPLLIGLALLGLITIGVILNWLNSKTSNIVNSWLVHILADSAIIIIGMKMFNIL